MKKILVAILAASLLSLPSLASTGGGKKKAAKKAKTECGKDNSCDLKICDPKNCDLKNCDPKNCQYPTCPKDKQCEAKPACTGNK